MHANQPYKWEYVKQKQTTSSDAIKQKYESELKRKLTAEELINVLQKDIDQNAKEVLDRVNTVSSCIQRLDAIALRPNPFSTPQYIDLIIDAEQQEKRLGFKERIESLKKLRQMAVITSKVKNNESLLSLDRKDDLADQSDDYDDDDDTYSNARTAFVDDGDNYDGASLTSAATDRHKFQTSFIRK
jgi:ferritin